jgi:DNA repair protein RecO (recombination protein O)
MATSRASVPLLSYVLHRYDWSETSLIVELFTRAQGRVVVIAKGAKRPTSQLRPVLLPFQPLHALLGKTPADAENEVHVLRSAEWTGGQPLLAAAAMFSGFYLNELLMKLLARQDPHPALFDAYADTLAALATEPDEAAALRAFELVLLRELGWLPELNTVTLTAEDLLPDQHYTLQAEAGIVPAAKGPCGRAWVALEAALAHGKTQGSTPGGTAALRALCVPEAAALRVPLRTLLHYHLGAAPLRTRQVWQGVQRLAQTPLPSP